MLRSLPQVDLDELVAKRRPLSLTDDAIKEKLDAISNPESAAAAQPPDPAPAPESAAKPPTSVPPASVPPGVIPEPSLHAKTSARARDRAIDNYCRDQRQRLAAKAKEQKTKDRLECTVESLIKQLGRQEFKLLDPITQNKYEKLAADAQPKFRCPTTGQFVASTKEGPDDLSLKDARLLT